MRFDRAEDRIRAENRTVIVWLYDLVIIPNDIAWVR